MGKEDDTAHMPAKGWAEMIRKVYEIDPLFFTTNEIIFWRVFMFSGILG